VQTLEPKIRELLQTHGVDFKSNSKSFIMDCPRCHKSGKLYMMRQSGRFVCFYCREIEGYQGKPEFALADLCGLRLSEVRKALYDDEPQGSSLLLGGGLQEFTDEDDENYMDIVQPLDRVQWPVDSLVLDHPDAIKGVRYLESRGIPMGLAMEYSIRYWPSERRVMFPVISHGNLLGYQSRLIEKDKPYWNERLRKVVSPQKILTNPELKRDQTLMFSDRVTGDHAILCEGPLDSLKAHCGGGNVAAMGKAVATSQLQLLRNCGIKRLYLALDPDAYLELDRLRKTLADVTLYDLRPPAPYKDLGDMPILEVKGLVDRAPILNPAQIVFYLKNHFGAK
jgi:hypothetical protein